MLDDDAPTAEELEELPSACLEYFEWRGELDAAKALRRWRQQAARRELEVEMSRLREDRSRGGKRDGRGRNPAYRTEFDNDETGSPPEVIEAFESSRDDMVKSKAYVGYEWDFTEPRQPPLVTLKKLGNSPEEQERIWKRMKRIAREAAEAEDRFLFDDDDDDEKAAPPANRKHELDELIDATTSKRPRLMSDNDTDAVAQQQSGTEETTRPPDDQRKNTGWSALPASQMMQLTRLMFAMEGENDISRMAATHVAGEPVTAAQIAEKAREMLEGEPPPLERTTEAVESWLQDMRRERGAA